MTYTHALRHLLSIAALLLMTMALPISFCGCASQPAQVESPVFERAREMLKNGQAECVLLRDGTIVAVERGHGVSPLMKLSERERNNFRGCTIVDKVIGRAAAFIAIDGGAAHVHGEVMSEDAEELLKRRGITTSCTLKVERILNQKRDGLCPLEQSVLDYEDTAEALQALKKRIAELTAGNQQN